MDDEQQNKKTNGKWTLEQLEQIKVLVGEGHTTETIARKLNISMNSLKYLFEKRGGKDNFSVDPIREKVRPMQLNMSKVSLEIVNSLNIILKKLSHIEQQLKELKHDTKN